MASSYLTMVASMLGANQPAAAASSAKIQNVIATGQPVEPASAKQPAERVNPPAATTLSQTPDTPAASAYQQMIASILPAPASPATDASGSAAQSELPKAPTAPDIAPITPSVPTYEGFQNSGFYSSANIAALQELLSNYNLTDEQARQQAEALYKAEYDLQKNEYENQLAQLSVSRDRDIKKLNSQYDKTLNGVLAGLNARSMGRSSLVATRGVETENARNAAISDTSYNYLLQQNEVNANLQKAGAAYARNVETKASDLKKENDAQRIQLQMQIAQLQQSGYSAYVDYLAQKDALANDMARLENEKYQSQLKQFELDNQRLQFKNEQDRLDNERLQFSNDQARLDNERLQYQNEQARLANEKARLENDAAKLENQRLEYTLAKKKK